MSLFNVVSQLASRGAFVPVVIDCGSAVTKVAYKGRILWEQQTVVAVDRLTEEGVSIGTTASEQLPADASHRLRMVNPVQNGLVANISVLRFYLNQLLKKITWVDGSSISSFAPLVLIERFDQSNVARKQLLSACSNLGRKVLVVSEKKAISLSSDAVHLPSWVFDFGFSHTSCALYDVDGYSVGNAFPWGLNRIYAALEKATARNDMALTPHQLEMVLQQIITVPSAEGTITVRKIGLTVKQLSTGASIHAIISNQDLETQSILSEWLWMLKQHVLYLSRSVDERKLPSHFYCLGGGSLLRGLPSAVASQLLLQLQTNLSGLTSLAVPLSHSYDNKK